MWEHPRTQPVHTQSAVAQSHYSACYWPLSHSAAQHWISQPRPVSLPLWGIDWLHDFLRCSSHTLSLSLTLHCPQCSMHAVYLSSVPLHSHLPVYLFCSFALSFCPSCSSSLSLVLSLSPSLSPLATVPALSLDNRIPYLAVCSAQPWQSCQFTCLDCCILYSVSKTHCNYNPCISKCTWYMAMSEQHIITSPNALFCVVLSPTNSPLKPVKALIIWHRLLNVSMCKEMHIKRKEAI